ncbi:MAG: hypothetical protein AAF791_06730 [Bacteroidota bacterium]
MRTLLLLPLLSLVACDSPCEIINGAQDDPAMQTCQFSSSLNEEGTGSFTFDDGAPVPFTLRERVPVPTSFPDGSATWNGVWVPPGAARPASAETDSSEQVYTTAATADRYALGMMWTGEVHLRSPAGTQTVRVADGPDENAARLGIDDWPNRAKHLVFSPNGITLFGADTGRRVTAWNPATGTERWTVSLPDDGGTTGVLSLAPRADGDRVAVSTARAVYVLSAVSGESLAQWAFPKTKTSVIRAEWTEDGHHLAVEKSGRRVPARTVYGRDSDQSATAPPTMRTEAGYQNPPTVFLLQVP